MSPVRIEHVFYGKALKIAGIASLVISFSLGVAAALLWLVLDLMGVWASVVPVVKFVGYDIILGWSQIAFGWAALTLLSYLVCTLVTTIGIALFNLTAALTGGIKLGVSGVDLGV